MHLKSRFKEYAELIKIHTSAWKGFDPVAQVAHYLPLPHPTSQQIPQHKK